MAYRYNFIQLEDNLTIAYKCFVADVTCEKFKIDLFQAIKNLSFAILDVSKWKNIDYDQTSYDYSLYLFGRIASKSFNPNPTKSNRFPWQHYIRKNIMHTITTNIKNSNWADLVGDIEEVLDKTDNLEFVSIIDKDIDDQKMTNKLLKSLTLFYTVNDIRKYLPLALNILGNKNKRIDKTKAPDQLKSFSIVLVSMAKRIMAENNVTNDTDIPKKKLKKTLAKALRSSIFLSSIVDSKFFPKEFLFSLDMESICRLVQIAGGKTMRIPTARELDTLLSSAASISENTLNGNDLEKTLAEIKKEYGFTFSNHINIRNFISNAITTIDIFDENTFPTEPLLNSLFLSIESLELLFTEMESDEFPYHVIDSYRKMIKYFEEFKLRLLELES